MAGEADIPRAEYLRRLLKVSLVEARRKVPMTQSEMATKLAWSMSKAHRIENGIVGVQPSDVRAMASLFGMDEPRIEELVQLAIQARDATGLAEFDDLMSPTYKDLVGNEAQAASITKYEAGVVPGFFQTERYGRHLSLSLGMDNDTAGRMAELRALRQLIFERPEGPEVHVVLGEIALVRSVGPGDVMREQITRLIELSELSRVSLLLLPFTAGTHEGMGLPFTILQFADPRLAAVLYTEDGTRKSTANEDEQVVKNHLELFESLQEKAEASGDFASHAERILSHHHLSR